MWAEDKTSIDRYGEILGIAMVSENLLCCIGTMCQCGKTSTPQQRTMPVCRITARGKIKQDVGS